MKRVIIFAVAVALTGCGKLKDIFRPKNECCACIAEHEGCAEFTVEDCREQTIFQTTCECLHECLDECGVTFDSCEEQSPPEPTEEQP
jgi:hypothetical protein